MWVPVGAYTNTAYAKIGDLLIGASTSSMSSVVVTSDGSPSAHFEHTVAITADGPWVLTALDDVRLDLADVVLDGGVGIEVGVELAGFVEPFARLFLAQEDVVPHLDCEQLALELPPALQAIGR